MSFDYATAQLFLSDTAIARVEMGGHVWLDSGCGFDCSQPDERECEVYSPESLGLPDEEDEMLRILYNPLTRVVLSVYRTRHVAPSNPGGSGDWISVETVDQPGIIIVGDIPKEGTCTMCGDVVIGPALEANKCEGCGCCQCADCITATDMDAGEQHFYCFDCLPQDFA